MPDAPIQHILRPPLPWRRGNQITECGRQESDCKAAIELPEAQRQIKKLGLQRASLFLCMTCVQTLQYRQWKPWESDPCERLYRELCGANKHRDLLERELRAIAVLIEAHRSEFDQLVDDIGNGTLLEFIRRQVNVREEGEVPVDA